MPSTETSPSVAADQLTRALGEAVIRIWSDLPQEVQDHLFKGAVASRGRGKATAATRRRSSPRGRSDGAAQEDP